MDEISIEEVEETLNECARMRKMLDAMQPALDYMNRRTASIERLARIWKFRLVYRGEEIAHDEN